MKLTTVSIIIAGVFILGTIMLTGGNNTDVGEKITQPNNVSIVDGVQIINLTARGGYTPRKSIAQAGIPTILRINTKGTFDCSATLSIPSMNVSRILPLTGSTEVDLKNPEKGILYGSCGMGMYPFEIDFQ